MRLEHLTQEERDQLALLVLQQLVITTKKYFTKETVLDTGTVLKLIDETIKRLTTTEPINPEEYE
jgi:hypothetical protein